MSEERATAIGQVLTGVSHGGHALQVPDDANPAERKRAESLAKAQESVTLIPKKEVLFKTPFGYLFPELTGDAAAHLPADDPASVVQGLKELGARMVEASAAAPAGDSTIPPIYTYWGQFIDHDLTANTDRVSEVSDITRPDVAPVPPAEVILNLANLRQPTLNLDSLYGDGPTFPPGPATQAGSFFDGIRFKIGTVTTRDGIPGVRIPPIDDLKRDLPRDNQTAKIADARNDENLIIAQLHTAFLRFHNNVVELLESDPRLGFVGRSDKQIFRRARHLTQWHYQWLTVNDFLRTLTLPGTVDKVLIDGARRFMHAHDESYMPLEYSVAAFRFGHTMIRGGYDHNRNFGRGALVKGFASLNDLFGLTGAEGNPRKLLPAPRPDDPPGIESPPTLPFNWIIEWDRLVDKGSPFPGRFARKIDTSIAPPLADMVNQGNEPDAAAFAALLKHLAQRNLLRGYQLSLPTGQAVAGQLGLTPLSPGELRQGNSAELNAALDANGFIERTPLWYYVLKEAEVQANGNSLGAVGSRIICETVIGQLLQDGDSYLRQPGGWHPGMGVRLPSPHSAGPAPAAEPGDPIVTIGDFLRFAGVLPLPRVPSDLVQANPHIAEQLETWQKERQEAGQDPNDYAAFRQHLLDLGAPDPGPEEFPGFPLA